VNDDDGEVNFYQHDRTIVQNISNTRALDGQSGAKSATNSVLDPIWIAMLTLYSNTNRSMNCSELAKRFGQDLPTSSLERYFRFMHDTKLIETRPSAGEAGQAKLMLTPRAVRLVEDGLRARH
jgi:hypothetical protein